MSSAWIVDDFNSDMHRLTTLIDLKTSETDERVDDILWIAREMADSLTKHDDKTPPLRMTGGQRNG